MDPDDSYMDNLLLEKLLNFSETNNIEFLQFNHCIKNLDRITKSNKIYTKGLIKISFQPELKKYFISNQRVYDCIIWDKFVLKKTFVKAIELIGKDIIGEYMNFLDDTLLNLAVMNVTKNYYFLNIYGYLYNPNPNSVTFDMGNKNHKSNMERNNILVHNLITYLTFFFNTFNKNNNHMLLYYEILRMKNFLNIEFYYINSNFNKLYLLFEKIIDKNYLNNELNYFILNNYYKIINKEKIIKK